MIVREGLVPVSICVLVAALTASNVGLVWSIPVVLLGFYLLWLFRLDRSEIPADPLAVLAPVAGRVVFVGTSTDPWLERDVLRIGLALPLPGVTVLKSPTEGKLKNFWTKAGVFSQRRGLPPSEGSPDCYALWIRTDEDDDVVCAVSSAWSVSRFRMKVSPASGLARVGATDLSILRRRWTCFAPRTR